MSFQAVGSEQPLIIPEGMQRTAGAEGLRRLAGNDWTTEAGWELDGDCPSDWKARVSTYLKAWAMNLDPDALLEMAQLLALAGNKFEGRQAAGIVAAWFPSYAPRFFAGTQDSELVENITGRARGIMADISNMRLQTVAQSECPASLGDVQSVRPAPVETQRDLAHEELMKLVKESSTRQLTDEEMDILTSRLCWSDEATRDQWSREEGIDRTDFAGEAKLSQQLDSEYPTEAQMREMWDAYESGKPGAMAEVLRRRREERKTGAK